MMAVHWSPEARADLQSIRAYIAKDKPGAGRKVGRHILEVVEIHLAKNPELGSPGRVPGTRELVIAKTQYIVAYQVTHGVIRILGVYSSAQRWPDSL